MTFDELTAELIGRYPTSSLSQPSAEKRLTEADVQRWASATGIPRRVLYNRIAEYLARGFDHSSLSFLFCDAIMNDLHAVITLKDEARPELFWKVFSAFDLGEFYHEGDRTQDPVEVFTRPQIAEILGGKDIA